jgi:hypothetical protein
MRPWLGLAVRIAALAAPLAAAFVTVQVLLRVLPEDMPRWLAFLCLGGGALLVGLAAERLARRLLPLSSLLGMTMLFPDRAPSRLRVLRASASTRQLRNRLADPDAAAADAAATTLALITALGGHDRRTRGHSERVRIFADLVGAELGLSEPDLDRLRWAALLHDIGKLEIAAKVLNKPGALDTDEWDRVRAHPLDGAKLAGPLMDWLGEWGSGIPEHHERYDGTGYPLGLTGTDISRAGRTIAVIDAFETMTAARAYKDPMSTRAARAELARCAGTHFDPQVVRAFLAISLPRLLWAMGPVAFLVHLPYLRSLEAAGAHFGSAVATASGATVIAVGAAVIPAHGPAEVPRPVVEQRVAPTRTPGLPAAATSPREPSRPVTSPPRSITATPDGPEVTAPGLPTPTPAVTVAPRLRTALPRVPRRVPRRLPLPPPPTERPPGLPVPTSLPTTLPTKLPSGLPTTFPTKLPAKLPLPTGLPLPLDGR